METTGAIILSHAHDGMSIKQHVHKKHMLNANLTVTPTGSKTSPAVGAARVYNLVSSTGGNTVRRIASTTNNKPESLDISHIESGKGVSRRRRSVIQFRIETLDDTFPEGSGNRVIVPSMRAYLVLDRPLHYDVANAVGLNVTAKELIGSLIDTVCVPGQLDQFLNAES